MLDHACIFTPAGVVLWSKSFVRGSGAAVSRLVGALLEERSDCEVGGQALRWVRGQQFGVEIFVVVVFSKVLTLNHIEEVLEKVKQNFFQKYQDDLADSSFVSCDYDEEFDRILRTAEAKYAKKKNVRSSSSKKLSDISSSEKNQAEASQADASNNEEKEENDISNDPAAIKAKLLQKQKSKSSQSLSSKDKDTKSSKKEDRVWSGANSGKMSKKQKAALDRSKTSKPTDAEIAEKEERELEQSRSVYLPEEGEKPLWEEESEEAEQFEKDIEELSDESSSSWKNSYFGNMIQSITGNKVLSEEDLSPVLQEMNQMLQSKNVAQEIADDICSSVGKSLVGHRLASFTRVSTVVMDALRDAVQRILSPSLSIDVLRQVLDARAEGKVFSAVFVGINGVGKSTSLAKVAYYLKQHGIKVLIAACDTFRSGAVEQLRTHSRCLDAPLFEMGYSKDPANVASCAISHAKSNGFDCVLIDTAGRMQNNEPLMKSLAKLVSENSPNLVLFVGEALVGNDGVDQLSMFNRALVNYSPPSKVHQIDGIVLTKFDTIDDKVGAALSMSYKSGRPITFVGTGQKYIHMKKLNVSVVLKHLFS